MLKFKNNQNKMKNFTMMDITITMNMMKDDQNQVNEDRIMLKQQVNI